MDGEINELNTYTYIEGNTYSMVVSNEGRVWESGERAASRRRHVEGALWIGYVDRISSFLEIETISIIESSKSEKWLVKESGREEGTPIFEG